MNNNFIRLHQNDNVAVAITEIEKNSVMRIDGRELIAQTAIPKYFKLSVRDIPQGTAVLKYGICIGLATAPIAAGELVHTHNIRSEYISSFTKNG